MTTIKKESIFYESDDPITSMEDFIEVCIEKKYLLFSDIEICIKDNIFKESEIVNLFNRIEDLDLEIRKDVRNSKYFARKELDYQVADHALATYLKEIGSIDLLTKKEEFDIAKKIYQNKRKLIKLEKDLESKNIQKREYNKLKRDAEKNFELYKNKMIQGNYRLVISIAKKYRNQVLQLLDLIEEGNIGLIKAVNKFDYKKGVRFSTFATWWIRQSIIKSLNDKGRTIRIPAHINHIISQYRKIEKELKNTNNQDPTMKQVADKMEIAEGKLASVISISEGPSSLDYKMYNSSKEMSDFISTDSLSVPGERLMKSSLHELIDTVLKKLTDKERKVIELRFGLTEQKPMVLEDVGNELKVTRERVRQIQEKALKKIRKFDLSKELKKYLN